MKDLTEILKDCPKGMELDCTLFDDVKFEQCAGENIYIHLNNGELFGLTKYGTCLEFPISKCVIFPKGKTTWEGFQKPFKDGDIVAVTMIPEGVWIGIFKQYSYNKAACESHCYLSASGNFNEKDFKIHSIADLRFATEKEKQKLFDAIKANGYKWDAETKTLEELIELKFKIGDRVKENKDDISGIVTDIYDDSFKVTYEDGGCCFVPLHYQDTWELVPNKFDFSTLRPFDKVLVAHREGEWHIQFFEKYSPTSKHMFTCIGGNVYNRCVPYEANIHLIGTTNDCDDFYKNWYEEIQ